jgi:hypothetical protein
MPYEGDGPVNELGSIIVASQPTRRCRRRNSAHRAARCDGYRAYRWHGGQRVGDIFRRSPRRPGRSHRDRGLQHELVPNDRLDGLFEATVLATEEAIVNALVAARTMTGIDGNRLVAIDHARLQEMLRRHDRLVTDKKPAR